jgi:cytochrome P450
VEGLPWWWEAFWTLPIPERGKPGEPLNTGDTLHVFRKNIEQIFGGEESYDGAPLATGDLASAGLTDGTMYLGLQKYKENFGDVYKLCFGPKSFLVVSDPQVVKHIMCDSVFNYDKGLLGEVLEDVMGKGLIPADFETWKVRRRAIVPGFHKPWLNYQLGEFGKAALLLNKELHKSASKGATVDMEERFGSVALDIIGKSVFNYEFGSTEKESAVVKAAIQSLREVEHRAQTPFQYWKLPLMDVLVERQREFKDNMKLLNEALNDCVSKALDERTETDLEDLENRDYSKINNPSLLRFLVDMKGEATSGKQLRDDMITMLIAGHETTASALTWGLFELAQQPELLAEVQAEIDRVMGDKEIPDQDDIKAMELVRLCFAESLRMYPEPPLLIRRALEEDTLPAGATGKETKVLRGMDFFVSIYNLQRDEKYWPNANTFDPKRWLRPYKNPDIPGWKGYDPAKWKGQLYPNEIASDYAFLPFGAGARKCVGDNFAMLEGSVTLAMVLRDFNFEFAAPTAEPSQVGTNTGATIHTKNGLWMRLESRR